MVLLVLLSGCAPPLIWEEQSLAWMRVDTEEALRVEGRHDLTGDGVADLLVVVTNGTAVDFTRVYPGPVAGELTDERALVPDAEGQLWSPGDVDGDGIGDLLEIVNRGDVAEATLHLGPLDGAVAVGPVQVAANETATQACVANVDGRGGPELIVPGGARLALVLDAQLKQLGTLQGSGELGPGPLVECLGDIDADGAAEVRVASTVFLDPLGAPGLDAGVHAEGLLVTWRGGDLDGDGVDDLLVPSGTAVTLHGGPITTLNTVGTAMQGLDDDWENARQVLTGGDANGDGTDDLLLGLAPISPTAESGDPPGGRLALFYGPVDGPLDLDDAAGQHEGELVDLACHDEETIYGTTQRECNERAGDETGEAQGDVPGAGFVGDQDGDGGDDVFLVTRTDYVQRGLWVLPGGGW